MLELKLNATDKAIPFLMVSSTDHITGKTGLTPTVTLSKNGGAFGAAAGTVAEIANGWYKLTPSSADTNTAGSLVLHATGTGADDSDRECLVVPYDPYDSTRLGLAALPNANAGANTGLPVVGTQVPNANSGANGGLPTVDANNAVKLQSGSGANQISLSGGAVTVGTNNDKTGYALTSGERDSIANALLDLASGVESGWTLRQVHRQLLAMAAGVTTGMDTTTGTVKNPSGTKSRVVATIDANGNRTPSAWDNS